VPTFIFDRSFAVSGAQETDVFLQVFDRLRRMARAS
jgi:predicted DsbA family dithiol-disulfide isomerase